MKEHVVISIDRSVMVPDSISKIGIQYDHNVNSITFDCPRYPYDGSDVDMSKMLIFVNYMLPDRTLGASVGVNVTVDSEDATIMHFDWKITNAITRLNGVISALVCVKQVDDEGIDIFHWNSDLFQKFTVGTGMESSEVIENENADVIAHILNTFSVINKKYDDTIKDIDEFNSSSNEILENIEVMTEAVTSLNNDIVIMSDTQPVSEHNKVWINKQIDEIEVPDMNDHRELENSLNEFKNAYDGILENIINVENDVTGLMIRFNSTDESLLNVNSSIEKINNDIHDLRLNIGNIEYISETVDELKKSVSDGKEMLAVAITEKGVETASDDEFHVIAENIRQIQSGGGSYVINTAELSSNVYLGEEV